MKPNTLAVWKNLETRLDNPFRENMVDLVLEMARDRSTDPKKIATWMLTTSVCICNAVFGVDDPMPLLSLYIWALYEHYPDTMKQIAEIYANSSLMNYVPVIASRDEFIGLLNAAGSTFANGELILKDDEIDITKEGEKRFKLFWKAPTPKGNLGPSVLW